MAEEVEKEEPQIKTIEEYHERAPRRWPLLAGYIVGAVIVALIIVFGARAIYHHYHKPAIKTVPANTKDLPKAPPAGANNNKRPGDHTTSGNLPNSGPGQVAAIFVGSSLAAGGAHFLISSQREKRLN